MKKVLPLHKPFLHLSPIETSLFATVEMDDELAAWLAHYYMYPYVTEYYIESVKKFALFANVTDKQYTNSALSLSVCPSIINRTYDACLLSGMGLDLFAFIRETIQQGSYVLCNVNCEYLDEYSFNIPHPILIYGYDDDISCFFTSDFFEGIYKSKQIRFDRLIRAIDEMRGKTDVLGDSLYGINVWRPEKKNNILFGGVLDARHLGWIILDNTERYINAREPVHLYQRTFKACGIGIYDYLIDQMPDWSDVPVLNIIYCLYIHAFVISHALRCLEKQYPDVSYIASEYVRIMRELNICMRLYMKAEAKNELGYPFFEGIKLKLAALKDGEIICLRKLKGILQEITP